MDRNKQWWNKLASEQRWEYLHDSDKESIEFYRELESNRLKEKDNE